jgi:CBS domain containing-hemolysin-like protein
LLDPIIGGWGITDEALILLIQTILSTGLVLITAEFLPKAFLQINPNGYLKFSAYPMLLIFGVLYLPTHVILMISNVALRLLRVDNETSEKVFSKVDLEHYVTDLNDRIHDEEELGNEMQILKNALDFDSVKARDCMVPRTDIMGVELDESIEKLKHMFIDTGKSKIIVYRESIDNIIGYVHSFEMFKSPQAIKQILLPIQFVPEATPGKELLEMFAKVSGTMAVVVDEYGGTAGIVTIEDVIEEIFGEIEDEHDSEGLLEEQLSESEYRFSARMEVDYLNDTYGFGFEEEEDYETLGGLVLSRTESIPSAGDLVEFDDYSLVVEAVSEHRIDVIRVRVK